MKGILMVHNPHPNKGQIKSMFHVKHLKETTSTTALRPLTVQLQQALPPRHLSPSTPTRPPNGPAHLTRGARHFDDSHGRVSPCSNAYAFPKKNKSEPDLELRAEARAAGPSCWG